MSHEEDIGSKDYKSYDAPFDGNKINTDSNAPKIASSVSFNNLNHKNLQRNSKSPFHHNAHETKRNSVTPHAQPAKALEQKKNKQNNDNDLIDTWKKAPKISKELPPAFGGPFHKSSSNIQKNINSNPFQANEPLRSIDQMVEIQEYKITAGLLSPLKKKNKTKHSDEVELEAKVKPEKSKKLNNNPLLVVKSYFKSINQDEPFKDQGDVPVEKIEKVFKNLNQPNSHRDKITKIPLKLNEMITINVMKSSHETGSIKKVLHAPTLKLFAVKEVPLNTKEARTNLKEWLGKWQSHFSSSKHHIKIHSTAFNTPEGCLSIVMELMSGGSLQNILESVGNLPEKALKTIAQQTLEAIQEVHEKLGVAHGVISPSQVLITKKGTIKLSLGLFQRIHHVSHNNFFNSLGRNAFEKMSLYELTPINNPTSFQKQLAGIKDSNGQMDNKQLATSQDIFDFGFLLLICAVGGLELFESSDFTEKLKIFLEELSKKPQERSKYCCLIHDEDLISSIKLPTPESTLFSNKPVKVVKNAGLVIDKTSKPAAQIRIQNVLSSNNFSKEFIDFLCACLKFDPNQRASTKELLHMSFLKHKDCQGPAISLTELLKISHQWSKNFVLPPEYQGASERELNKVCEALSVVLPNCDSFATSEDDARDFSSLESLDINSPEIQELASDLGVSADTVAKRIKQMLQAIKDQNDGKENKKEYVY